MSTEPTTDPADEVTGHQPTLPAFELPDYHGRTPVGMRTSLAGAGTRVTKAHTIGDRVVLVIEARVKNAAHEETDDGLVYSEKMKVLDLFELDRDQGSRLLTAIRSIYRTGEDRANGRHPLPDFGEIGYTDASGVVLTPEELAELRNDPVRAVLSPDLSPVVVVYEDGTRDLWPDDFPKDAPRPSIGDRVLTETGDAIVDRLLNHITGEEVVPGTSASAPADAGPEPFPELPEEVASAPAAPAEEADDVDPFAGDLGDDVAEWETPDPATAERMAEAEAEQAPAAFLDRPASVVLAEIAEISSVARLHDLLAAEKTGRGRSKAQRPAVVKALTARMEEVNA